MNILAIETTGANASVAIINEKEEIEEIVSDGVLNHLENLTPIIKEIVEKCQLTLDDIDVIAASEGPGSFTGIRIGVSTARALAQALNKPAIGVPTLQSFIYNKPHFNGIVCPIFDARRSEIYGGAYRKMQLSENGKTIDVIEDVVPGAAYDINDYLDSLSKELELQTREDLSGGRFLEVRFFGDGIKKYKPQIDNWASSESTVQHKLKICFEDENPIQRAASDAKLALKLYMEKGAVQYEQLKPNYMRKSEAERKLEDGTLKRAPM